MVPSPRAGDLFMTRLEQDTETVRREQHIEKATDKTVNIVASVNVSNKMALTYDKKTEELRNG